VILLLLRHFSTTLTSHLHTTSLTKSENELVPSESLLYTHVYQHSNVGVFEDSFNPRLLKFTGDSKSSNVNGE
jgi:hypothetical protein